METNQIKKIEENPNPSTTQRIEARFYVRTREETGDGDRNNELGVTDFAELQRLYHSGFIASEDEIRRHGSDAWRTAGTMPELMPTKPRRWLEGNEFALLAALLCFITLVLIFIFK